MSHIIQGIRFDFLFKHSDVLSAQCMLFFSMINERILLFDSTSGMCSGLHVFANLFNYTPRIPIKIFTFVKVIYHFQKIHLISNMMEIGLLRIKRKDKSQLNKNMTRIF